MKQDDEFTIFMAYAQENKTYVDNMRKVLKSLQKKNSYRDVQWYDMNVSPGEEFERENEEHLNSADIILLLISLDFLSSDYSYDVQIKDAIRRHEEGQACVIPVLLYKTDTADTPFIKLRSLPDDKPIGDWRPQRDAYANISEGIRRAIDKLREKRRQEAEQSNNDEEPPPNVTPLRKKG